MKSYELEQPSVDFGQITKVIFNSYLAETRGFVDYLAQLHYDSAKRAFSKTKTTQVKERLSNSSPTLFLFFQTAFAELLVLRAKRVTNPSANNEKAL